MVGMVPLGRCCGNKTQHARVAISAGPSPASSSSRRQWVFGGAGTSCAEAHCHLHRAAVATMADQEPKKRTFRRFQFRASAGGWERGGGRDGSPAPPTAPLGSARPLQTHPGCVSNMSPRRHAAAGRGPGPAAGHEHGRAGGAVPCPPASQVGIHVMQWAGARAQGGACAVGMATSRAQCTPVGSQLLSDETARSHCMDVAWSSGGWPAPVGWSRGPAPPVAPQSLAAAAAASCNWSRAALQRGAPCAARVAVAASAGVAVTPPLTHLGVGPPRRIESAN